MAKNFSCPTGMFPTELTRQHFLPSGLSAYIGNKCDLGLYLMPFFVVIPLFTRTPKHSAEVLSSVPKCMNIGMCIREICIR